MAEDAGRCTFPEGYSYSCVRLYERNEKDWIFLTHHKEREGCLLVWSLSLPACNTNKGKVMTKRVSQVEKMINERPVRKFNYLTPNAVFLRKLKVELIT
ncbi:MAG: hypothetical protein JSS93_04255 [Bacteroidetes bacterium]|nr:hypothetical protein [Bacteroidota bacterium]